MDLGPFDHQFNMYLNRDLSDIRRSTFNRAIMRLWGDTWIHLDTMMEIGRRNWRDCEIVAQDHRAIMAHDHRAIVAMNEPSLDQTACISRAEILINIMFFLCVLNS